jgi:Tol biopolymer transport system component
MKAGINLLFVVGLALLGLCGSTSAAWTEPIPVVEINTDYHDRAPFLSFDGLTLYFARQDGPGWHYARLYQATRTDLSEPFTSIKEISTLNYPNGHVDYAWVSPDNLRMYYYRTEPGSIRRIKFTKRATIDEEWKPGYNISVLYDLGDVSNPSLTPDELTIVFTGRDIPGGQGGYDLWMATRYNKNVPFTNITNLAEINSTELDAHPSISSDGLTLYFDSNRNGTGQLFKATRDSLDAHFDKPEHLSFFDSPGENISYPSPSRDGTAFYFVRWSENDMADIYVSYISDISETNTRYVDAVNGNNLNNGRSPETAFATIQKSIDSAKNGFTILVYPGIYTEKIDFKGKAITLQGLVSAAGIPVLENPDDFTVCFYDGEGPDSVMKNFVIRNSFMGIFIAGTSPTISNVTVVFNKYGINAFADAQPDISNCILWDNTNGNLYGCQVRYSCLKEAGAGGNNINDDPLLADPDYGDYHLLSEYGRYWSEHDIWVIDEVTSPCIDGGNPTVGSSREPTPNGGRLNMGAYGGTRYASMSEM